MKYRSHADHSFKLQGPRRRETLQRHKAKRLQSRSNKAVEWPTDLSMEVFPNPSSGPLVIVYEVPKGEVNAELRLMDVHGRMLKRVRIGEGPGFVHLTTEALASGVYMADLSMGGIRVAQQKVVVQH